MPTIQPEKIQLNYEIAIVVSTFNQEITENLWRAAMKVFLAKGFLEEKILTVWVPGAIEIPLMAQTLLETSRFAGVLALGAVIRGETDHYDYVCQQVSYGCQKVALEYNMPLVFGIVTADNEKQAEARSRDNDENKGKTSAQALLDFLSVLRQVEEL